MNCMSIIYRDLETGDKANVAEINSLLQQMRNDGETTLGTTNDIEDILNDPSARVLVAQDGSKIVGIAPMYSYLRIGIPTSIIEDVVVDERYRRQGIGEALVGHLVQIAKKKGTKTLFLTCRSTRAAARGLYKKLGFNVRDTSVLNLSL
jgi:ribosomal protein S18 acetylase RimI-like enzyme